MNQFGEHAVEPDAHHERAFPRFDVDIAGARFDGVDQQVINQDGNFDALVGNRLQIASGLIHR
jgi:hypothetical protein